MEPTTTTPWRTLEAPTEPPPSDATRGATSRRATMRIVAAGGAAIAFGAVAFLLAVGAGSGGVVVEGSAGLGYSLEPGASPAPGWGFHCLHAHCAERHVGELLDVLGLPRRRSA